MDKRNKLFAMIATAFMLLCALLMPVLGGESYFGSTISYSLWDLATIGSDYMEIDEIAAMVLGAWVVIVSAAIAVVCALRDSAFGVTGWSIFASIVLVIFGLATDSALEDEAGVSYGFFIFLIAAGVCIASVRMDMSKYFQSEKSERDMEMMKMRLELEQMKHGQSFGSTASTAQQEEYVCCPSCGKKQRANRIICFSCGYSLAEAKVASTTQPTVQPATQQPAVQQPSEQQTGKAQAAPTNDEYMYCQSCGKHQSRCNVFCPACGSTLSKD